MTDEAKWKRRFYLFMGARLFGVATFLFGLAIMYTNILRPGGWPAIGAVVVILGVVDAVVAPHLLRKHWRESDAADE